MEPWQSWTIASLFGVGAIYYYTTSGGQKKRGSSYKPFTPKQAQRRNSSKSRNEGKDKRRKEKGASGSDYAAEDSSEIVTASAPASGNEVAKKRGGQKEQQSSKLTHGSALQANDKSSIGEAEEDDGMDNQEFAKQLSDKMQGTSLKKPDGTQNKKSRRQAKRIEAATGTNGITSKASGVLPMQENSTASSTTGADADDDRSFANSPELGATNATTPSATDVSDMLEPPAKGPSVLRLTGPENPQPQRQPKPQKAVQEPETKKQRQNRRKKEEQKAMREQDEKERRIALENQRRTVREAEGRPAKNGLESSHAPSSNAWSSPSNSNQKSSTPPAKASQNSQLLDTFEEAMPSNLAHGKAVNNIPPEEEQIKLLNEMESDNSWNTVSKGGKSKKKGDVVQTSAGNGSTNTPKPTQSGASTVTEANTGFPKGAAGTSLNAQVNGTKKEQIGAKAKGQPGSSAKATRETIDPDVWNRANIHEHPDYDPAYPYALTGHPDDSEWAVV